MPRVSVTLAAGLLLAAALAAPALALDQAQYEIAARTILCDCGCHPQSVHDCACGRAAEMRRDVAQLIEQGLTGEQVIARYVEQHGEGIRIAPTASGFNLVAWLGPLVGLVAGSGGLFLLLRRSITRAAAARSAEARLASESPSGAVGAPGAQDDDEAYRARLRRELEQW